MSMTELEKRCVDALAKAQGLEPHETAALPISTATGNLLDEVRAVLAEAGVAAFVEAREHRDNLKRAVIQWMNDEGARGHLRQNDRAPMWVDYANAEESFAAALTKIGANQ